MTIAPLEQNDCIHNGVDENEGAVHELPECSPDARYPRFFLRICVDILSDLIVVGIDLFKEANHSIHKLS